MPGPVGSFDNIIRKTMYDNLLAEDRAMNKELQARPQQPYRPGTIEDMLNGLQGLYNMRDYLLTPPEDPEYIYKYRRPTDPV